MSDAAVGLSSSRSGPRQDLLYKALIWFWFSVLAEEFSLAQKLLSSLLFLLSSFRGRTCPGCGAAALVQTKEGSSASSRDRRLVLSAPSLSFLQRFCDLWRCSRVSELSANTSNHLVLYCGPRPPPSPPCKHTGHAGTFTPASILLVNGVGQGVTLCVFSTSANLFIVCQLSTPSLRVKRGRLVPTVLAAKSCCSASVCSNRKLTKQVRLFYTFMQSACRCNRINRIKMLIYAANISTVTVSRIF